MRFTHQSRTADIELAKLRRTLHREAELSGQECRTAEILEGFLRKQNPDRLLTGIGGNGILAVYHGNGSGGQVLLRCDMDAVPVVEETRKDYLSRHSGVSHACGHDGHMSIMAGVARELGRSPAAKVSALLLFQPGEETGSGARLVMRDPVFSEFQPRRVFALHNLPGFPMGSIVTSSGPFAEASRGLVIHLRGRSSHAGEPLLGISPAPATAALINGFGELCRHDQGVIVTLIHARIGEVAFGTSPEKAVVMATLRAPTAELMDELSFSVLGMVKNQAEEHRLKVRTEWTEEFPPTINSPEANSIIRESAESLGLEIVDPGKPFPWSEDFGHFTEKFDGALFGLGAGNGSPPLHDPFYDFPDGLIGKGVAVFMEILERTLNLDT